ncbi:hypothetical protein QR680_000811 [Steinernema hermaphroditum]|uniref:BESS domain-containing protein n=1 Tax=Steinernema hermaphroditum TaxID=289476 RepID=A0AA39GWP2_9BILA|nr:hypothetical protein QR680_000811 [Steinernema hermaphroditum]
MIDSRLLPITVVQALLLAVNMVENRAEKEQRDTASSGRRSSDPMPLRGNASPLEEGETFPQPLNVANENGHVEPSLPPQFSMNDRVIWPDPNFMLEAAIVDAHMRNRLRQTIRATLVELLDRYRAAEESSDAPDSEENDSNERSDEQQQQR